MVLRRCLLPAAVLVAVFTVGAAYSANTDGNSLLHKTADTPPLGWNSYDAYHSTVNEKQIKDTADFMAKHLKQHGWEYVVIDFIWWNPFANDYNKTGLVNLELNDDGAVKYPNDVTMDKYGRLLPAVKRFPSSVGGKGFKPLADYIHSKGLKFGIHIMRGIHRHAYYQNSPILGTDKTARDIAKVNDHARWLNNMFGVDQRHAGSQEYYDSIFKLYAEWGVDYIKADDMMGKCGRPFIGYSGGEIAMMRKGIDNSGRPMVLSLSCGEAPISQALHLQANANMWRVSSDFWDRWDDLSRSFQLLDKWSAFIGDNTWPDADMIPIGRLSLNDKPHSVNRLSRFTVPEHYTLMTLFSIARSPLMIGGDLLSTPFATIKTFFKNDEVLYVNQHSINNRQVIRIDNEFSDDVKTYQAIWIAEDRNNGDYFLGLFNLSDKTKEIKFDFYHEDIRGKYRVRDLWARKHIGTAALEFSATLEPHGAGLYRLSRVPGSSEAWIPPKR